MKNEIMGAYRSIRNIKMATKGRAQWQKQAKGNDFYELHLPEEAAGRNLHCI